MADPQPSQPLNLDVLNHLPLDAAIVVEVGCGTGELAELHRRRNPAVRYYGIELDAAAAKLAEKRMNKVVVGDMETVAIAELGLEPGTVDCLVYNESLERMRDPW